MENEQPAVVRAMSAEDLGIVAEIHRRTFPRQTSSVEWIECNYRAYPRVQYYVIEDKGRVAGFIEWLQKSGFRQEVILELEQLGIDPDLQGRGFGSRLIKTSLPLVARNLAERGATLKHVIVTTRADNFAKGLYTSALGASVEATITNLYSADEVLMIARNVDLSVQASHG